MTQNSEQKDDTLSYYEENAKGFYKGTVNVNMATLYAPFLSYMPSYAKILDAGCGSGRDTLFFSENGFRVTAFDYSSALVKLASKLTGQEILNLSFQNIDFKDEFDGIWACSSLLHVPSNELHGCLSRLSSAMKTNGILYTSFKYGQGEHERNGRHFVDFDEDNFDEFLKAHPEISVIKYWKTSDLRTGRENEKWLNLLARKTKINPK